MATEPLESAPETTEQAAPPVPTIASAASQGPPTSPTVDAGEFEKFKNELLTELDERISKRVQSQTDVRFKSVDKINAYLKRSGGDVDKAMREMQIDDLLAERQAPASPQPDPGRSAVDNKWLQDRTAEILNEGGVSTEDPEYQALLKKPNWTESLWLAEVGKLATRKAKQGKAGSPAAVITDAAGKPPAPPGDVESLTKDYYKDMLAARGDAATVRSTKEKYRKLGVPVDQVVF